MDITSRAGGGRNVSTNNWASFMFVTQSPLKFKWGLRMNTLEE